jgi:tetratricopeptide (TPR) repeat protein
MFEKYSKDRFLNLSEILERAVEHLQRQEYGKARSLLVTILKFRSHINDQNWLDYVLMSLGSTYLLTDAFEKGISFFSEYINLCPEDAGAYRERAALLWYTGHMRDAVRDYSRVLELKPDEILALSGRGQVLAELGEHGKAIEDLDAALEVLSKTPRTDPNAAQWFESVEAFAHNGRAVALAGLGETLPAMAEFDVSIRLCPGNAWVYYNRAQVFESTGELERARADYQQALINDGPPLNRIRKAHAQQRLNELSKPPN